MVRWSNGLILLVVLSVVSTAVAYAQERSAWLDSMEQNLTTLSASQSAPVVSTLWMPNLVPNLEKQPESLEELAEDFGLKVFEQDGVYVIAPEKRRDLDAIFAGDFQPVKTVGELSAQLLQTLDDAQWRMIGSEGGLSYQSLTREQQALAKQLFGPGFIVTAMVENPPYYPAPDVLQGAPAKSVSVRDGVFHAYLDTVYAHVENRYPDRPGSRNWGATATAPLGDCRVLCREAPPKENWDIAASSWPGDTLSPPPMIANTLKPSDLDYDSPKLRVPVSFDGKFSLQDLVSTIAKKTGMPLHASPGSDQVSLFISASNTPAGSVLKAFSLATMGTWRGFDTEFVFVPDKIGIGQLQARIHELGKQGDWRDSLANAWEDVVLDHDLLRKLPFEPGCKFIPSNEQLDLLWSCRDWHDWGIKWSALTPEQQSFLDKELSGHLAQDTALRSVLATIKINLAFQSPGMGVVRVWDEVDDPELNNIMPCLSNKQRFAVYDQDAPQGTNVPLTCDLRGCIRKPKRADDVAEIVASMERHGLNTLVIKVFTDGFTAFPSTEFPMISGLDPGYLEALISHAHSKGIKVWGMVDVLRWSDGIRRKVSDKDILDYDILGRTSAELLANLSRPIGIPAADAFYGGNIPPGEAVSPSNPSVHTRLQTLIGELGRYDLDGLVLDDFSMMSRSNGMLGHNGLMRQEFLRRHSVDSIDVPPSWSDKRMGDSAYTVLGYVPLQPVISSYYGLCGEWRGLYREACDDLLDGLIKKWCESKPDHPIWIVYAGQPDSPALDWAKLKGRIAGDIESPIGSRTSYSDGKSISIFGAHDGAGTLRFAQMLAQFQHQKLGSTVPNVVYPIKEPKDGILIDLSDAGRKEADYLRLIATPETK